MEEKTFKDIIKKENRYFIRNEVVRTETQEQEVSADAIVGQINTLRERNEEIDELILPLSAEKEENEEILEELEAFAVEEGIIEEDVEDEE